MDTAVALVAAGRRAASIDGQRAWVSGAGLVADTRTHRFAQRWGQPVVCGVAVGDERRVAVRGDP
jgi:hypothetical protein